MDTEFWHARWENNQTGFHRDGVNPCLEQLWPMSRPGNAERVLVPLCGKSHDLRWLREQGYHVVGSELSPLAVAAFFSEYDLEPDIHQEQHCTRWEQNGIEILCGDFLSLEPSDVGNIDAFYDRAALIALTPAQRPGYARRIADLVMKGTPGLLVTLDYNQLEMGGPPFAVSAAEVHRLFSNNFEIRQVYQVDSLEENPKLREKGLTELSEQAYHLVRR